MFFNPVFTFLLFICVQIIRMLFKKGIIELYGGSMFNSALIILYACELVILIQLILACINY